MRLDNARVHGLLKDCDFTSLFVEKLGWSHCRLSPVDISIDEQEYTLTAISEMGGLVVFRCDCLPDYHVRRKIDRQVSKLHYEHIIIYCGEDQQVWQWVKKEHGEPSASREHVFRYGQSGTPLIQRLDGLVFTLDELDADGNVSISAVSERVKTALDVDKVTKKFYDRFKNELTAFKSFIQGIQDTGLIDWYASLMMNRLMFIYFVQKKGFLDGDANYLRSRLRMVQEKRGKNHFFSFYHSFLRVLFHEGLNSTTRTPELRELIGDVPYLNGGLFEEHEIERENPYLDIPDEAFEKLFDFFDQYEWHLDTRPMRNDREINPDVLGYIFEKYVNQKQMGAYYTKEDITEYISKNTIIPYIFDAARQKCAIAFEGEDSVWRLLQERPDNYIYPAMKLGVIDDKGNVIPESALPDFVQIGMHDPKARMFDKRYNLTEADFRDADGNKLTLPTETWREYVNRRNRCLEVREKLKSGEVRSIDDLITLNLDIRQFAQDVIENTESPDLLRSFWEALRKITVLDPTCGSGAFLFAALNILEPLYDGCLERMREFLDMWGEAGKKAHPNYCKWFEETLRRAEKHPNLKYYIYKSIILNNLYGVDIMPEAVEICKLRLFLKLAAQVDPDRSKTNLGLEPLPDIDFNIRAGNTLVGFATYDEVKKAVKSKLDFEDTMAKIEERAREVDELFELFRQQQVKLGGEITPQDKRRLRDRLKALEDKLNVYLAREYVIDAVHHEEKYRCWLESHRPFHWFVEFYGIMKRGGFDVIIGNPPYVEYSKVKQDYQVRGFATQSCGNIYAMVIERCIRTLRGGGRISMIVQLPIVCTDRMAPLQNQCHAHSRSAWFATFDDRPGRLFDGLEHIRATVFAIAKGTPQEDNLYTTTYTRWYSDARPTLFEVLSFAGSGDIATRGAIPKVGHPIARSVYQKVSAFTGLAAALGSTSKHKVYFHNAPQYWIRAMDFVPYFWNERDGEQMSSQVKPLCFNTPEDSAAAVAALNSTIFYWWFIVHSDCRHLNMREIETFPLGLDRMADSTKTELTALCRRLMDDLNRNKARKECYYRSTGKVVYDEFYPRLSKPIIDEIDCVLAKHYGL
jgi:hypothetical protein